jgi:hypothetical protein
VHTTLPPPCLMLPAQGKGAEFSEEKALAWIREALLRGDTCIRVEGEEEGTTTLGTSAHLLTLKLGPRWPHMEASLPPLARSYPLLAGGGVRVVSPEIT